MHVISKPIFTKAIEQYPNQKDALNEIYRVLSRKSVRFETPEEMMQVFPSLDNLKYKKRYYVIDVGGNHLHIIVNIIFRTGTIFIKHIVTHAEYDKLNDRYRRGEL